MPIRHAVPTDLPAIVAIYNASIPGRMATADLEPVAIADRVEWFRGFDPARRPLWVYEYEGSIAGWLSLRSYYGRPAYHRTVESAVYVDTGHRRRGIRPTSCSTSRCARRRPWASPTCSRSCSSTTQPSVTLFDRTASRLGPLPRVCEMDGVERGRPLLGRRLEAARPA